MYEPSYKSAIQFLEVDLASVFHFNKISSLVNVIKENIFNESNEFIIDSQTYFTKCNNTMIIKYKLYKSLTCKF